MDTKADIIEFAYCGLQVKVNVWTGEIESVTADGYEINDLLNAKADRLLDYKSCI